MENIMKIVKFLENSGLLLKLVSATIQNEAKEQNRRFLSMLLVTLAANLLGNMFSGKGINRAGYGYKDLQSNKGRKIIKAGYRFKLDF